jgi:hypothetical protein
MAKLSMKQIQALAKAIIAKRAGGIRYGDLQREISAAHRETPVNTIHAATWNLASLFPDEISKPSRGLFRPANGVDGHGVETVGSCLDDSSTLREAEFYAPFADYLKNDLDEATNALPLGGAGMQRKWATPDVLGVYKPLPSDRIKFEAEIIAAEIKIDPQQPVVAFGQAAAYRLFAAKSYVVMPDSISEEDASRLEALSMLFGIGLVLFRVDVDDPHFRIRVRAQRFTPDMFYVNEFAERLHKLDPGVFNELFR